LFAGSFYRKGEKMTNKNFPDVSAGLIHGNPSIGSQRNFRAGIIGMLALVLVFSAAVVSCDNGNNGTDGEKELENLPAFEGDFVANEEEAAALATGADVAIRAAIDAALAQESQKNSFAGKAAVSQTGHYYYNGISLDYAFSGDDETGSYTARVIATVDGTYVGYRVIGKYNYDLVVTSTSSGYTMKFAYDCVYTVSYNGKGMKVIQTGSALVTTTSDSSVHYNVDLHYTVYDNGNVRRYNYDYNDAYTYP
jgi:hypothetical protein